MCQGQAGYLENSLKGNHPYVADVSSLSLPKSESQITELLQRPPTLPQARITRAG